MKTLYLHIGTPKTGTTAIQDFCGYNHDVLCEKGVYYPHQFIRKRKGYPHHNIFPAALRREYKLHGADILVKTPFDTFIQRLKTELSTIDQSKNVLISAECFTTLTYSKIAMERLFNGIKSLAENIKIIVYLRRQDIAFQSWYAQEIKRIFCTEKYITLDSVDSVPEIGNGYDRLCDTWAEIYGKENIIVHSYERQQFPNGDIITDFLNILGVEKDSDFKELPVVSNPSLPRDFLEYKRLINLLYGTDVSCGRNFLPERMYPKSKEKSAFDDQLLPPSRCLEIIERFQSGNAYVAHEYMKRDDGILFQAKLPDPNKPFEAYPGIKSEKAVEITQGLITLAPHKGLLVMALVENGLKSDNPLMRDAAMKLSDVLRLQRTPILLSPLKHYVKWVMPLFKLPLLKSLMRFALTKPAESNV